MPRLLDGPDLRSGPESLASHLLRLGPSPTPHRNFVDVLSRAGLTGKGGAGFPAAVKWQAVAKHSHGRAVVVANGAEGEPQSAKDRLLMSTRPHLILDGAFIAAGFVHARRVVLYIGENHSAARQSMLRAIAERGEGERRLLSVVAAPARYVAGQESAAIHLINEGVGTPTTTPPFPFERGVDGAATLVHNVETLAHVALIARSGTATGTSLITLAGGVARRGVIEVDTGTTIGEAVKRAGGLSSPARAVLVGGYFGSWVDPDRAWSLPLDHTVLLTRGLGLGCGVVGVLPDGGCPVCETAGIMRYLAGESSAQCGPCFFGLRALAGATTRISQAGSNTADLARLQRWAQEVRGRGGCKHPDGAVIFLQSALKTFADEFADHTPHGTARAAGVA